MSVLLSCSVVVFSCRVQLSCSVVVFSCRVQLSCSVVVAISLVATDMVCLHDVSLMYNCVESAHGVEGGAPGQHTWHT
jgi:hypothetical protein